MHLSYIIYSQYSMTNGWLHNVQNQIPLKQLANLLCYCRLQQRNYLKKKQKAKCDRKIRKQTWESTTQSPLHFAFFFLKRRKQRNPSRPTGRSPSLLPIDYPVIDVNTRLAWRWNWRSKARRAGMKKQHRDQRLETRRVRVVPVPGLYIYNMHVVCWQCMHGRWYIKHCVICSE